MRLTEIISESIQTESLSDVKAAWDTGVDKIKKIMTPDAASTDTTSTAPEKEIVTKPSPFDSVDPVKMKELVKNVLAKQELTLMQTRMLQDLYKKL
jgi:hypothetical protein